MLKTNNRVNTLDRLQDNPQDHLQDSHQEHQQDHLQDSHQDHHQDHLQDSLQDPLKDHLHKVILNIRNRINIKIHRKETIESQNLDEIAKVSKIIMSRDANRE